MEYQKNTRKPQKQKQLEHAKLLENSKSLSLFDYQMAGANWLSHRKYALLADKQRLGKSVQSIHAIKTLELRFVLVVCRAVAISNWENEFIKWGYSPTGNRIKVISYERMHCLNPESKYELIIVDESHYIKNPTAKRTLQILGRDGLIHRTKRMWLLTGTPAPNNAAEMWTVLFTFGRTKLTYDEFIQKYCVTKATQWNNQIIGTKTDSASIYSLKQMTDGFMLRRTEADVDIEMPKMFYSTEIVTASKVSIKQAFPEYTGRLDELDALLEAQMGIVNAIVNTSDDSFVNDHLLEVLKSEAASVSTLRRYTALQKVDALVELIKEELESKAYEKVVIFAIHTAAIEKMIKDLSEFHPASVFGKTKDAAAEVDDFQNNPICQVFIGNISAAGTSISLTAAHHIYFLEQAWTPGDNAQAAMRCGGVNQKNPIFIKTICLKDGIDNKVNELLVRKASEISKFI